MAKLLFITQKVDQQDHVLGFVCDWIKKFSLSFDSVVVMCLQEGQYGLPLNVKILSLGKEKGGSKVGRLIGFYRHIWRERNNYDGVFVHMNPVYAVLGGLFWRIWRKKVLLWYLHPKLTPKLKIAHFFANNIATADIRSFPIKSIKVMAFGHGIDTNLFKRDESAEKTPNSLLFLGRVSPVKRPELFIDSLKIVNSQGVNFSAVIMGDPVNTGRDYYEELKQKAYGLAEFKPGIPYLKTPEAYNQYEVYVNTTPTGSLDKTILEAMACKNLVVATNPILKDLDERLVSDATPKALADSLVGILDLPKEEKENLGLKLREYVVKNHNLNTLALKIAKYYE